jgi:arylsulfatase
VKSPLIVFCPGRVQPAVCESLVSVNIDLGPTILELANVDQSPRMQGVSLTPLFEDPSTVVRDFVFSEHNWHVMQANERMVRHGKYLLIKNHYPQLQSMCVESAPAFPAGRDLWDAHDAGTLTKDQQDIFTIPRPGLELYDVVADPHQLNNLANDESHKSQVAMLNQLIVDWTEQTKDSISSDPTPDRQTAQGKKHRGWRHRTQPGVEIGSIETNAKGPIRTK